MPVFPDGKVSFWPQVPFVSQVCRQTYQQIRGRLISSLDSSCAHQLILTMAILKVGLQVLARWVPESKQDAYMPLWTLEVSLFTMNFAQNLNKYGQIKCNRFSFLSVITHWT